jgi:hypothetical protein
MELTLTRILLTLTLALAGCGLPTHPVARESAIPLPPGEDFGAGITLDSVSEFRDVIQHPESYSEDPVVVRAKISEVCQRRGCWMVLRDGDSEVRVRFKDYGFFVPKNCSGKVAFVEGRVKRDVISEKMAKHYAEESKRGDPSEIRGPQSVVSFEASGVRLVSSP